MRRRRGMDFVSFNFSLFEVELILANMPILAMNSRSGEVLCNSCGDFIYDPHLEDARSFRRPNNCKFPN